VLTAGKVDQMYRKLALVKPEDHGIAEGAIVRAKTYARKAGWTATPGCWDEDTIDDPSAFPEWTGQCGTVYGFRVHYREGLLPVCEACSKARSVARRFPGLAALMGIAADPNTPGRAMPQEDYDGIVAALREGGTPMHEIANAFGCSTKTVTRIRADVGL
jgi:hypothetical protein